MISFLTRVMGCRLPVVRHLGGHRNVHRLGSVAGSQRRLLDLLRQGLVLSLDPLLEFVDGLADGGAILLGDIAQALGQACDLAVFAQVFLPEVRKLGFVSDRLRRPAQ